MAKNMLKVAPKLNELERWWVAFLVQIKKEPGSYPYTKAFELFFVNSEIVRDRAKRELPLLSPTSKHEKHKAALENIIRLIEADHA